MINLIQQTVDDQGKPATYQAQIPKKKKDPNTGKMVETMGLEEKPITVKRAFKHALLSNLGAQTQRLQKRRYDLYLKIRDVDEIELTWRETRLIRKLVAVTFDVIVYGQIADILKQ